MSGIGENVVSTFVFLADEVELFQFGDRSMETGVADSQSFEQLSRIQSITGRFVAQHLRDPALQRRQRIVFGLDDFIGGDNHAPFAVGQPQFNGDECDSLLWERIEVFHFVATDDNLVVFLFGADHVVEVVQE